MQNKHQTFFLLFLAAQLTGRGGGAAGWAKCPTFPQNGFLRAPLTKKEFEEEKKLS